MTASSPAGQDGIFISYRTGGGRFVAEPAAWPVRAPQLVVAKVVVSGAYKYEYLRRSCKFRTSSNRPANEKRYLRR